MRTESHERRATGPADRPPIIIAFAGTLRAMGVLSTTATVFAIGLSIAIAVVLFTTQ
jgi:hypothetical protein